MIWHFVMQFCGQRVLSFSATINQFFGHDLGPLGGFSFVLGALAGDAWSIHLGV